MTRSGEKLHRQLCERKLEARFAGHKGGLKSERLSIPQSFTPEYPPALPRERAQTAACRLRTMSERPLLHKEAS